MANGVLRGETEASSLLKLIEMIEVAHINSKHPQEALHSWDAFTAELGTPEILSVVDSLGHKGHGADLRGMLPCLREMVLVSDILQEKETDGRYHAVFTPPPQILQKSPSFELKGLLGEWNQLACQIGRQL